MYVLITLCLHSPADGRVSVLDLVQLFNKRDSADESLPIGLEYSPSFNSVKTTGITTLWPLCSNLSGQRQNEWVGT